MKPLLKICLPKNTNNSIHIIGQVKRDFRIIEKKKELKRKLGRVFIGVVTYTVVRTY